MSEHKFKIGQLVHYYPKRQAPVVLAPGLYQIVRRLPLANGEPQYEIRSTLEEHRRHVNGLERWVGKRPI